MAVNFKQIVGKNSTDSTTKAKSRVWLNPFITVNDERVYLPVGIALDTMKPLKEPNNNSEYAKDVRAKNSFLAALQSAQDEVSPGERVVLDNIKIELYHVKEEDDVEIEDTPQITMADLLQSS